MSLPLLFDISDSPQININLPFVDEVSESVNFNVDNSLSQKRVNAGFKLAQRNTETRSNRSYPMVLNNVDGVVPEELYELAEKKMPVQEIEKHLTELEKV